MDGNAPSTEVLSSSYSSISDAWTAVASDGMTDFASDNQFHDRSVSCITMSATSVENLVLAEDPSEDTTSTINLQRSGLPAMRGILNKHYLKTVDKFVPI